MDNLLDEGYYELQKVYEEISRIKSLLEQDPEPDFSRESVMNNENLSDSDEYDDDNFVTPMRQKHRKWNSGGDNIKTLGQSQERSEHRFESPIGPTPRTVDDEQEQEDNRGDEAVLDEECALEARDLREYYKQNAMRPTVNIEPGRLPFRTDPVKLYEMYKETWKNERIPGESPHNKLRWEVRNMMKSQMDVTEARLVPTEQIQNKSKEAWKH
ncbi:hypothetical protein Ddc_08428 [Ditylenchus destructor]|nr:hypothetical protein Ddc_08428 [Ditylenchus destructor]